MIPKKIHFCWFGGNPYPKSVKKCISSWRKYCPDYEIIEWNETNYDVNRNKYMSDAYKEKKWGFVPDFARVDIIYEHGGIYLDTDVQLIKNLDSLLNYHSVFGFEDDHLVNLGHGFAAEKNNEIIKRIRDSYQYLSFYKEDGSLNLTPSPQLNTKILVDYGFTMDNQCQNINGNFLFSSEYFDPKDFHTGLLKITANTYSIHQYDASWYDEDMQEQKIIRWKKAHREYRIDRIKHSPNRILKRLIGSKNYEKLKFRFKADKDKKI